MVLQTSIGDIQRGWRASLLGRDCLRKVVGTKMTQTTRCKECTQGTRPPLVRAYKAWPQVGPGGLVRLTQNQVYHSS